MTESHPIGTGERLKMLEDALRRCEVGSVIDGAEQDDPDGIALERDQALDALADVRGIARAALSTLRKDEDNSEKLARPHTTGDSDLVESLHRLARWCRAKDPIATIWLHAIEAADFIEATLSTQAAEIERRDEAVAAQEGWHNPVHRVALRAGFILCREYMARFVEGPGSEAERNIATSIRANWIPALGDDPGPPRKMRFDECVTAEDMELGPWEAKDPGLSVEAACYALCAMADLGMTIPDDAEQRRLSPSQPSKG